MTSLTEFLLARITEDEAAARAAQTVHRKQVEHLGDGKWGREYLEPIPAEDVQRSVVCVIPPGPSSPGDSWTDIPGSAHFARFDPARVLADCEIKRRIVRRAQAAEDALREPTGDDSVYCIRRSCRDSWRLALSDLALAYADHPDWREEWRP